MAMPRSECAVRSLGLFGLTTDDVAENEEGLAARARESGAAVERGLGLGQIALIVGPSAAGKSSILRALAGNAASVAIGRTCAEDAGRTVIDCLARGPNEMAAALGALSAAGLADAFVPARRVGQLSEGERARFGIARAMMEAERRVARGEAAMVLLDDFGDNVDEATADAVCHGLRRWLARQARARVVIATLRSGLARHLRPEMVVDLSDPGNGLPAHAVAPRLRDRRLRAGAQEDLVRIERGTLDDYAMLAHFHYRAGKPATVVQVLVARVVGEREGVRLGEPGYPEPDAVLTISMPTLNGAWRARAWPEMCAAGGDKSRAASELNRSVRCVSRVIVHPRVRGRGVGARLIREYLARPLTDRTEALSAMGAVSPLFVRAGMREWVLPHGQRDLRLLDALSAADLRPWMLADVELAMERVERFPHLERALRVWAMAHGHTRAMAYGGMRELVRGAAKQIITPRRAYTHG